ncbi:MAG: hypothetical protein ACOYL6_13090 [Bacteriovoracaceae bacterium]
MNKSIFVPQLKIADMFSMAGLCLVGVGLGAHFHLQLAELIAAFLAIGVIMHLLGMYGKYQIEHHHYNPPVWVIVTFVLLTIGLIGCGIYVLISNYIGLIVI